MGMLLTGERPTAGRGGMRWGVLTGLEPAAGRLGRWERSCRTIPKPAHLRCGRSRTRSAGWNGPATRPRGTNEGAGGKDGLIQLAVLLAASEGSGGTTAARWPPSASTSGR